MKEYANVALENVSDYYVNATFSRQTSWKSYSHDGKNSAFQMMLQDGWVVISSAIQTQVCSGERKHCFILEREVT